MNFGRNCGINISSPGKWHGIFDRSGTFRPCLRLHLSHPDRVRLIMARNGVQSMKALIVALLGLGLSGAAVPAFAADEAACKTAWDTADANKDGSLDATEGTAHLEAIKTSGKAYDADNDGKLTAAEFTEACKADTFKDIK
jgi:hypothetical protein